MKKPIVLIALSACLTLTLAGCDGGGDTTSSSSTPISSSEIIGADRIVINDDCPTQIAIGEPFNLSQYVEATPANATLSYRAITENVTVTAEGVVTPVAPGEFGVMVEAGTTRRRFEAEAVSQNLLDIQAVLSTIENKYQAVGMITDASTYEQSYIDINVHNDNYFWSFAQQGGIVALGDYSYQYSLTSEMSDTGEIIMTDLEVLPGRYTDFSNLIYGTPLSDYSAYISDILDQNGNITGTVSIDRAAVEDFVYYVFGGMPLSALEMMGGIYNANGTYTIELIKDDNGNTLGLDVVGNSPALGTEYLIIELTSIGEDGLVEPVESYIASGNTPVKLENPNLNARFAEIIADKRYKISANASVGSWSSDDLDYRLENWEHCQEQSAIDYMYNEWGFEEGSFTRYMNETSSYSFDAEGNLEAVLPHDGIYYTARGTETDGWGSPEQTFSSEYPDLTIWDTGIGTNVNLPSIGTIIVPAGLSLVDATPTLLSAIDYREVASEEDGSIRAVASPLGDNDQGAFVQIMLSQIPFIGNYAAAMLSCLAAANGAATWIDLLDPVILTLDQNGDIHVQVSMDGLALNAEQTAIYGMLWEFTISDVGVDQVPSDLESQVFPA